MSLLAQIWTISQTFVHTQKKNIKKHMSILGDVFSANCLLLIPVPAELTVILKNFTNEILYKILIEGVQHNDSCFPDRESF